MGNTWQYMGNTLAIYWQCMGNIRGQYTWAIHWAVHGQYIGIIWTI